MVVNEHGIVLGRLGPKELAAPPDLTVEAVMQPGPATVRANEPLDELLSRMEQHHVLVMVVDHTRGTTAGCRTRSTNLGLGLSSLEISNHVGGVAGDVGDLVATMDPTIGIDEVTVAHRVFGVLLPGARATSYWVPTTRSTSLNRWNGKFCASANARFSAGVSNEAPRMTALSSSNRWALSRRP